MNSITKLALIVAVSLYIRMEHMILDAKVIPNPLRGPIKNVKENFMSNALLMGLRMKKVILWATRQRARTKKKGLTNLIVSNCVILKIIKH